MYSSLSQNLPKCALTSRGLKSSQSFLRACSWVVILNTVHIFSSLYQLINFPFDSRKMPTCWFCLQDITTPKIKQDPEGTSSHKCLSLSPHFLFKGRKLQPLISSLSSKGQIQFRQVVREGTNKGKAGKENSAVMGQGPSPPQCYTQQSDAHLSSATRTKVPTPLEAEYKHVDPRLVGTRGLMIEIPGPPSC